MPRFFGHPAGKRIPRRVRVRGFTLLEVLIVIAIVAALFAIGLGAVRGVRQRAAISRTEAELALLAGALEEFKRLYGDYPQTGMSAPGSQRVDGVGGPAADNAQSILFHALTGAYGPAGARAPRLDGPMLVELSKFSFEVHEVSNAGESLRNAFVDPWGNRYVYCYRATPKAPWDAAAYLLFSAGPDGETTLPDDRGVFVGGTEFAADNADNIYAGRVQ